MRKCVAYVGSATELGKGAVNNDKRQKLILTMTMTLKRDRWTDSMPKVDNGPAKPLNNIHYLLHRTPMM